MDNELLIKTTEKSNAGLFSTDKDPIINLKQMLSLNLYKILEEMEKKILNGRIKNPEKEKIRLEYIKAYINGCNCFKSITDTSVYKTEVIKEYLNTTQEMVEIEPDDDPIE